MSFYKTSGCQNEDYSLYIRMSRLPADFVDREFDTTFLVAHCPSEFDPFSDG
tara:strand:+ start:307 stop:462 length:156 start_codon:yes stop_codon:yes gene_type:complete